MQRIYLDMQDKRRLLDNEFIHQFSETQMFS